MVAAAGVGKYSQGAPYALVVHVTGIPSVPACPSGWGGATMMVVVAEAHRSGVEGCKPKILAEWAFQADPSTWVGVLGLRVSAAASHRRADSAGRASNLGVSVAVAASRAAVRGRGEDE